MSIERWNQVLSPHADRADRISVIASETDIPTGIIDDVTDVDKAYFENAGPSSDTGTAYAAICDILDLIHGRIAGTEFSIGQVFQANSSGRIGINGAPATDPSVQNMLWGKTWVSGGDLGLGGGLYVDGTTELSDTVLNTVAGEYLRFKFMDLDQYEQTIPSRVGQVLDLLEYDDLANLTLHLHGVSADHDSIVTAEGGSSSSDAAVGMNFVVESEEYGKIFSLTRDGALVLGPKPMEIGDYYRGGLLELYSDSTMNGPNGMMMYTERLFGEQVLAMFAGTSPAASGWQLHHEWGPFPTNIPGTLSFQVTDDGLTWDTILSLSKDYARVVTDVGGQGYFEAYLDSMRWAQIHTKVEGVTNRSNAPASSITPALLLSGGRSNFSGKLGFDAWHEWNSLRLWVDDYSGAGCIPTVAIGEPLGTNAAPIDAFVVMKDPFGAGVGVDHRDLYSNHSTKDGFHVGPADGDAGTLWLWATTGHVPGIHFGADDPSNRPILTMTDGGAVLALPGATTPSNFGSTGGDFVIIPHSTLEDISLPTGRADIANELSALVGQNYVGSAVFVYGPGTTSSLWVSDGTNWNYFLADGTEALV